MSAQKVGELRKMVSAKVPKMTKGDLNVVLMILALFEQVRALHRTDELPCGWERIVDRNLLLLMVLHAHEDDVPRMLKWVRAVRNNGEDRRNTQKDM